MPAIKARKQADGSVRYTAVVRIRRKGKVLQQEAKTFAHRSAAVRWGKHPCHCASSDRLPMNS